MAEGGTTAFRLGHTLAKSLPHTIPPTLQHNDTHVGVESGRELIRFRFEDIPFNPQKRIARIYLPTQGVYDYARCYFEFTASCSQTGGTYVRFPDGFWNIISQVRLLDGSREVWVIRNYNVLHSIIWEMGHQPGSEGTLGAGLYGIADAATRNGWAAGHDYIIPFNIDILNSRTIDFTMLQNALQLEITFETPARLLETDGATYTYSITELNIYPEHLKKMHHSVRKGMRTMRGLHWPVDTYRDFTTTFDSSSLNWTVPFVGESMTGLMLVMRDSNTVADPTVNDKFKTYNYNNAIEWRIKLNEQWIPEETILLDGQGLPQYMQLLKFLGHWESSGEYGNVIPISPMQYLNNKFVLCMDLEDHPHYFKKYINMREAHPDSNFQIEVRFNGAPVTTQEVVCFIHARVVAIIKGRKLLTTDH